MWTQLLNAPKGLVFLCVLALTTKILKNLSPKGGADQACHQYTLNPADSLFNYLTRLDSHSVHSSRYQGLTKTSRGLLKG